MRKMTLCFLVEEGRICLAMKKRGFGKGKWNGVGGKVEEKESVEQAATREIKEEIGVEVGCGALDKRGVIDFYFKGREEWNQRVYVFLISDWRGEPCETEEMAPKWYKKDDLPFGSMWVDDLHWLPRVLRGERIKAEFYFDSDGTKIENFRVEKHLFVKKTPLITEVNQRGGGG